MKKLTLIMIMLISISIITTVSAQETPPLPSPPYSATYPDSTYEMTQEQLIGGFAVRVWKNLSIDEFMFADIATLQWNAEFGTGYIQIDNFVNINALTGTDINGDGYPDVIIETYSGGAHCCSSAHVFTLQPNDPIKIYQHRLSNCSANFQDMDGDGIYEINTCDDSFAYVFCPYAMSYPAPVILGYDSTLMNYIPMTGQYAGYLPDMNQRIQNGVTTAQNAVAGGAGEWDNTTKCQVLPIVLDYLYSGQSDAAWEALNAYYREADLTEFRAQIEQITNSSSLYRPAIPPTSNFLQPPFILDQEFNLNGYSARIWKRASGNAFIYDGIGVLEQNGMPIAQFDNVMRFSPMPNLDINGNGTPDIAFETYSGGAHCCTSIIAYDLGATPVEILRTRESNYGGRFEDIDFDGLAEFITADDSFAYAFCPYAFSPAIPVILGYDSAVGRYVVMNTSYPERYADAIAESITDATTAADGDFGEWDGTNKCAVLPVVLSYLYSGQYDMAWTEFYRLYRGADADTFRAEIEAIINASMYYVP
ncbi:MAG: hypothetical protein KJ043_09670 [Anaerolineae bacterium]|nr:hypothetical protein [Anaerolineae bacterium]